MVPLAFVLLLHTPASRTRFLHQTYILSSLALRMASTRNINVDEPISLLDSVYGRVDSPDFPVPMPEGEAGLCADGHQRRYLWTDAFAVLAFCSIAERYESEGKLVAASLYRNASNKLINVVHECLGAPVSSKAENAMHKDPRSPTGYMGLRIGKVNSRRVTDAGMEFDGQYWHYVDKWLFALERAGRSDDAIKIAKSCFPYFFDSSRGGGIRWKLSVDGTPPSGLEHAYANQDTLSALVVFSVLGKHNKDLAEEISMLRNALDGYRPRVTTDPLGWGLEAFYNQFLQDHPMSDALESLQARALDPSHLSLPFRLYGAMIGARIAGIATQKVDSLEQMSLAHEARVAGREEHSCINRVMLAMCLLSPGALCRRHDDPLVKF